MPPRWGRTTDDDWTTRISVRVTPRLCYARQTRPVSGWKKKIIFVVDVYNPRAKRIYSGAQLPNEANTPGQNGLKYYFRQARFLDLRFCKIHFPRLCESENIE